MISVKQVHPRRTAVEIKVLLRQQEKGAQTIKAFCQRKGIAEQTFYKWRKRYTPMAEKQEGFIPIGFSQSASSIFAEIERPGKMVIRLFQKMDADYLKTLAK